MRRLLLAIVAGIVAAGAVGLFAHDPIKDFAFRACRSILPDDVGVYRLGRWLRVTYSVGLALPGIIVAALVAHRWRKPNPANACRECGYDLTGNTSGRCSECGNATATTAKPK
jgi:tRNA(Ile2) C34 agmatinyltransferase TiaS